MLLFGVNYHVIHAAVGSVLPNKTPYDRSVWFEMHCAREAIVCMEDTHTTMHKVVATAAHVLKPGALAKVRLVKGVSADGGFLVWVTLFRRWIVRVPSPVPGVDVVQDIRELIMDYPSSWYLSLLDASVRCRAAASDTHALATLQRIGCHSRDWRLRRGMVRVLVEVLAHGGGAADVRERVIAGVNRGKNGVDQLGLTHLLRDGRQNVSEAAAAVRTFALSQSGGGPSRKL